MQEKQLETAIDALHTIRFIRRHYASSPEAAKRMLDVVTMLREAAENTNAPFLSALAMAIEKGWEGKSLWQEATS